MFEDHENFIPCMAKALTFHAGSDVARYTKRFITRSSFICRFPQVMHTSQRIDTNGLSKHDKNAGSNLAVIIPVYDNINLP